MLDLLTNPLVAAWLWLLAILFPLVWLERWIHRHLQGIWMLVLRDKGAAMVAYSLIMLPGVVVHELSHWLAATFLMVRTGRFSVVPERKRDGMLQLGYVETEKVDPLREALIGVAPLVMGAALIIYIGRYQLGVGQAGAALGQGDLLGLWQALSALSARSDAGLWVYAIFVISNTMLPSASDRRAWLPVAVGVVAITGLLIYIGFGALLASWFIAPLDSALRALNFAFTLTVIIDLACMPVLWLAEQGVSRLTRMKVNY